MDDDQQFCLRWNNHQSTLVSVFDTLLVKEIHVDCTLAAEGRTLKAHKVVLSACSPYFESVLSEQFDKHPIIILKDVKFAELRAMMDYMYRGEVNISQDQLAALLKAAESLQIKGLSDNKPSRPPSRPPPAPAHPPRAPSPPPQTRDGSSDSRSGSLSPSRRRKKARRASSPGPGAPPAAASPDAPCKEELARDVEDLTLDDGPPPDHADVVRNFQWHMERSQDEIMNSNDSVRETQEVRKDSLPSLLSLLSGQRAQSSLALPALPALLQHAHALFAKDGDSDGDADGDADDTDDIVLPDELGRGGPGPEDKARRDARDDDDASRQFECRHCGKRYRWKSTLRRHENVECGGKAPAHQCPYCAYRAKQRGNLGVHIRKHHNTEWYVYATSKVRRNKKTSV